MGINIDAIKRKLLIKYPALGKVIARLKFEEFGQIDTACTDGKRVLYNSAFIESLTIQEQIFIFAHEVCHVALDHIIRSEKKDKRIWNIATDAVINAWLKNDNLPIIEGGIDIPEAINYDAEEFYDVLMNQQQGQKGNQGQNNEQNGSQGQSNGQNNEQNNNQNQNSEQQQNENQNGEQQQNDNKVGHDSHEIWEKVLDELKKEREEQKSKQESAANKENNEQENDDNKDEQNESNGAGEQEGKEQEEEEQFNSEKDFFNKNREERERIQKEFSDNMAEDASFVARRKSW